MPRTQVGDFGRASASLLRNGVQLIPRLETDPPLKTRWFQSDSTPDAYAANFPPPCFVDTHAGRRKGRRKFRIQSV
jgi:hypothetical protein